MRGLLIFPVLLILLFGTPAFADFQKGLAAYQKGDYATALKEIKPLAEQGHASAQHRLGVMYNEGLGVTQDYKAAVNWTKLAAKQGLAHAQYNLGIMYNSGQGVIQDYKAAVKWYRLAAEQGSASAQSHLGTNYVLGKGIIKDYVRAHMWWNIAASLTSGPDYGDFLRNERDELAKTMTTIQIAEAQKLARECVAKNYKGC